MYFQWILKWYSFLSINPDHLLASRKVEGEKWSDLIDNIFPFTQLSFVIIAMSNCIDHMLLDAHARVECMNINSLQCIACGMFYTAYFVHQTTSCR